MSVSPISDLPILESHDVNPRGLGADVKARENQVHTGTGNGGFNLSILIILKYR